MPVILIKLPRFTDVNGHEKVVSKGGEWFVADTSKAYSTSFGQVPPEILQKPGKHVIGKDEFCVIEATPGDIRHNLRQDVQKIVDKDLGFIAAFTGAHKDIVFAEAGSGSGGATTFFAPLVKEVVSYDIRNNAEQTAGQGLRTLNITNVTFKTGDVTKKKDITCTDIDVFLLDVPEPWHAWESMACVKQGGWVVGYTPNANQLEQFVNAAPKNFMKVQCCELIQRHWRVKGLVCRPETADFSHTAFLSFFRRIY